MSEFVNDFLCPAPSAGSDVPLDVEKREAGGGQLPDLPQTARNMGGHRFRQAVHDVACLNQNGAVGVGRATDFWVFSSESVRKPSARRGGRAQVTALKENLEGSRGSAASGAGRSTAPHFLRGPGENGASANHLRGRNRPRL
jgi:hypothetical protein